MYYLDEVLAKYRKIYNDRRDFLLYFFCYIDNGKIKYKKQIDLKIMNCDEIKKKDKIDISLYKTRYIEENHKGLIYWSSKILLASGKIILDGNMKKMIDIKIELNGVDNPYKLIGYNENDNIGDFINYYNLMKKMNNIFLSVDNRTIVSYKKYYAMEFYKMVRDMILQNHLFKDKYYITEPNVFIKDYPIEYDFLIINNKNINKGIYSEDEVLGVVELKAGTLINKDINILTKEKYFNKPLIYISGYQNKNGIEILKKYNEDNIYSYVFCVLNNSNSYDKFFASNGALDFNNFIEKVINKW